MLLGRPTYVSIVLFGLSKVALFSDHMAANSSKSTLSAPPGPPQRLLEDPPSLSCGLFNQKSFGNFMKL